MSPKFGYDADGDTPPCNIIWDIKALDRWEDYKNKVRSSKRKAPCSCHYFEGNIPSSHVCTVIKNKCGCFSWFTYIFS